VLDCGWMARAYSDDLRRKLLEAHTAGKGTLAELAERFGVSLAWAWKISSARKRTGSMERTLYPAGPKTRVNREAIRALLEAKPDLYLYELQAQMEASTGQRVSKPHLWKIAGELGFRRKKSRSTPPSETRRRTGGGVRPS
jgi:transposase